MKMAGNGGGVGISNGGWLIGFYWRGQLIRKRYQLASKRRKAITSAETETAKSVWRKAAATGASAYRGSGALFARRKPALSESAGIAKGGGSWLIRLALAARNQQYRGVSSAISINIWRIHVAVINVMIGNVSISQYRNESQPVALAWRQCIRKAISGVSINGLSAVAAI